MESVSALYTISIVSYYPCNTVVIARAQHLLTLKEKGLAEVWLMLAYAQYLADIF